MENEKGEIVDLYEQTPRSPYQIAQRVERIVSTDANENLYEIATSHASAVPPTVSSRPRTMLPSKSASLRLTRTADTPVKTRSMLSPDLYELWARVMTA